MKILIDNDHGADTPGKRSPDGALLKYAWNREIAARIVTALTALGLDARLHLPGKYPRTDYTDGDPDLEADFYILRHTSCPSVLVENLFMDSKPDCRFLLSEEGKQAIVNLHVDGINFFLGIR